METYKITFKLDTPCCITDMPTFDGLLAYCHAKELNGNKPFVQKMNYPKDELIDFSTMPVEMHENGYFMASSMVFNKDEAVKFIERWRKRWANKYDKLADFGKTKRRVSVSNGQFKSYDAPIELTDVEQVCFYFRSNDVDKVKYLLRHLYGIGKKISQGHGLISDFKIEKSDFDFTGTFRPIPLKFFEMNEQCNVAFCSWRPPYWMNENFDVCAIPNFS